MTKLALLGAAAIAGLLFFTATPASADGHIPEIAAEPAWVPAVPGTYTVTIEGFFWEGAPDGLFVTICSAAEEGDANTIDASNALTSCPTLVVDGGRGNPGGGSTWSYDLDITVTDTDITNGTIAVLAGELAAGSPWSASLNVFVGDPGGDDMDDMMADTGAESGLIAVIGASVLAAGLLAVGVGRRLSKRS